MSIPTARQLRGWNVLAAQVAAVAHQQNAAFVAAAQYGVASELAHSLPPGMPVVAVGPRWAFFALPPARPGSARGCWSGRATARAPIRRAGRGRVWQAGAGRGTLQRPIETFRLYAVPALPRAVPAVMLPRP